MTSEVSKQNTETRERVRADAEAMGITPELISNLVDRFYENVRAHPDLGPIFEEAIGDDWDAHLLKLKSFWSSIAFHDGSYSGRPVPAHMKLSGLTPQLFGLWLAQFDQTLIQISASQEAHVWFMQRARRIAESLTLNIFYNLSSRDAQ